MRHSPVFAFVVCLSLCGCDTRQSAPSDSAAVDHAKSVTTSEAVSGLEKTTQADLPLVQWAKPGLAPLFINSDEDREQGIGDQMFVQIQSEMPQFRHMNLFSNYARLLEEMRKGSDLCAILHKTPKREEFMVFSEPVVITPSYQLYISQKGMPRFIEKTGWDGNPIAFDDLLSRSRGLSLAVTPGQSYGVERDTIIERHLDKIELIRSFADHEALIKMLAAERMDMVLGFPWVVNYRLEKLDIRKDLVKIPLNDVAAFETAYIACSDTPVGRRVVDAVNAISPPVHDRAKSFLTRWLTAEESIAYYRVYHDFFIESVPLP